MTRILSSIILLISLVACGDIKRGSCSSDEDGEICVIIRAEEPIQYGESITVTITVTSTINIAGLGIYLYSSPPILMEDINGWVDNGINWVIDITANQPQSFNRHVSLPEKDGLYQILSSADTPQLHTVYSFYIHQLNGNSVVYYPNTPIPITPGVLSTPDPNTLATLYAMPSSTPWPTIIPRPTATVEVTSTPYPLPVFSITTLPTATPVGAIFPIIAKSNVDNLSLITKLDVGTFIWSTAVSPDSNVIAVGHSNGKVTLIYLSSLIDNDYVDNDYSMKVFEVNDNAVLSLTFNPNGTMLAATSGGPYISGVSLIDTQADEILDGIKTSSMVTDILSDLTKGTLIFGKSDGTIDIWDWKRDTQVYQDTIGDGGHGGVCSLALSPDSTSLAVGNCDYTVSVWDMTQDYQRSYTLKNVRDFNCQSRSCGWLQFNRVKISPRGNLLASVTRDENIPIWDIKTGQLKIIIGSTVKEYTYPNDLAFNYDGTMLAVSNWNDIYLYDVVNGQILNIVSTGEDYEIQRLVFSDDGKLLVSGDSNGKVYIWGVITPP